MRALYSGATITVALRDNEGATIRTVTKTYAPNFFQQTDAATFTGGAIAADQSIKISETGGSIIIYGATTDNATNDPAVQYAEGS